MTDVIIRFPDRPKPAALSRNAEHRPAQILFFTGVRYERQVSPVLHDASASPDQNSPGRDTPKQGNGQRRRRRG